MYITIIMMNIKNIFITTGISFLFGVYSIYNIFEYIKFIHYSRITEINDLNTTINETKMKYNELEGQFTTLQTKYDCILLDLIKTGEEIVSLNIRILELQNNESIATPPNSIIEEDDINCNSNSSCNNNIICDDFCDMNLDIPRINMATMNTNYHDLFDPDFMDYNSIRQSNIEHNTNTLINSFHSNSNLDTNSLSTSVSVKDINWSGLTNKFFFG